VDDLIEEFHIEFVDVLHADIQSYEYEMLKGSTKLFKSKKIGYIFISTHSDELPSKCLEFLREKKFIIIADVDLANTYSFDGLLVARSPEYPGLGEMKVSLKKRSSPLNSSITSLILCQLRIG
jgi:hypothetical protein